MATPRKVRIIYDESNTSTTELAQIQIVTEPKITAPPEAQLISFSDMNQIYVKREWIEKCPILAQPVIFHDFNMFKKYIKPLLNGDSLRWSEDVDTKQEIGQLINEISKYGITLNDEQILDISNNCGITKLINEIKTYIYKTENKCWGKKIYKARFDDFCKTWDKYVDTLAIQYHDPIYQQYKAQIIYNILTSDAMYNLLKANISKNNIIYEFCEWFRSFIILQVNTFSDHVYEIASRLDLSSNMNPADIATLILNMITSSKSETLAKSTLVQKITDLLKFRSLGTPNATSN